MITKTKIVLIVILVVAYVLRSFNSVWDGGYNLHPDERAIIMTVLSLSIPETFEIFLSPESTLNPRFFAYGNMPFYILMTSASFLSLIDPQVFTYSGIAPIGRQIIVGVELLTLVVLFFIARKLFSESVALIATALYSICVFPIQLSHFFTVDPFMSFFILLTLLLLLRLYERPSYIRSISAGCSFGLALASKVSAVPLLVPIGVTMISMCYAAYRLQDIHNIKKYLRIWVYFLLLGVSSLVVFVITQPYVLIDIHTFLEQSAAQSQMTRSAFTFPYTLQYVGKISYVYEAQQVFLWGFGPIATSFALYGIFILLTRVRAKKMRVQKIIVFSFMVVYFLIVGNFAVGWMRYLLPIYPMLALLAGIGIFDLFQKIKSNKIFTRIGIGIISTALLIWPATFMYIYTVPHTRIAATEWILQTIPPGSRIAVEHWDDRLPLYGSEQYTIVDLPLYDLETNTKWDIINTTLESTDYIVIASNRLYTPLQKMTNCRALPFDRCYTQTSEYYNDLFAGTRGFKKVKEFSVYPTIPFTDITINDQLADESFTVYDHPKIQIFQKIK